MIIYLILTKLRDFRILEKSRNLTPYYLLLFYFFVSFIFVAILQGFVAVKGFCF